MTSTQILTPSSGPRVRAGVLGTLAVAIGVLSALPAQAAPTYSPLKPLADVVDARQDTDAPSFRRPDRGKQMPTTPRMTGWRRGGKGEPAPFDLLTSK